MTTYIYCPRPSNGALELVRSLGATRLRKFDGLDFWQKGKKIRFKSEDVIVCWGNGLPELDGPRVLNADANVGTKYQELAALRSKGIPSVVAVDAAHRSALLGVGVPIGRMNHHVGGNDLLKPPARPDYFTAKENLVREYRIHSFAGKSIRAGVKVPREGFLDGSPYLSRRESGMSKEDALKECNLTGREEFFHPWIRSFDGGWRINYDGFSSNQKMRALAHKAVKALGLTFGAVDIGERHDGGMIVLEVNRSPGIEGGSIEAYTKAITKWIESGAVEGEEV